MPTDRSARTATVEKLQRDVFNYRVSDALEEARKKHGRRWRRCSLPIWALILAEEAGEVARAALDHHLGQPTLNEVQREAAQTAAMAFKVWEKAEAMLAAQQPEEEPDGN